MRVMHLSYSDSSGGACRAAFRIHNLSLKNDIASQMQVAVKRSDLHTIDGPRYIKLQNEITRIRFQLARQLMRLQNSSDAILRSSAILPSYITSSLNELDVDVLNLHWICNEFLSIEDIGSITKPLVWTMHDMWPFSGAEHYGDDGPNARWRKGYYANNRPQNHSGVDLDQWVWQRKFRRWKRPMQIVAPSEWLAKCARESALMHDWPISVIPYPIDTDLFRPWPKTVARQLLGLPQEKQIIVFGAIGGMRDPRKGWDLLQPALAQLSTQMSNLVGVIFGQSEPQDSLHLGLPLHWAGSLHDEITLALLYSAADVAVVPSRQDNLPQIGVEAQSCGCPVVAFNITGLPSVIIHRETGYLATPFNVDDLIKGIAWVLADPDRHANLSNQSRERAVRIWSPNVIAKQYMNVYEQAIQTHHHPKRDI